MYFRSMCWLLPVSVLLSLMQGCGGMGGGGSSRSFELPDNAVVGTKPDGSLLLQGEVRAREELREKAERKQQEYLQKINAGQSLDQVFPGVTLQKRQEMTEEELIDDFFFKTDDITPADKARLETAQKHLIAAYKNSRIEMLPELSGLVSGSYLSRKDKEQQRAIVRRILESKGERSLTEDMDGLIQAMERVRKDLESNNPALPSVQPVLTRAGSQQWRMHVASIEKIRKSLNGEQRFNDLSGDMPMVADASGSNALLTGLETDQWYFYGQGYTFRGHWEPAASTRQDYKGNGMELGLLKALSNGWAFGGMVGIQKVTMEYNQAKADANVYRVGPFLSWSDDNWSFDGMLTYGWIKMDTEYEQWKGSPKGSEWAAHVQGSYAIPLDHWAIGLKLVPEAYVGYRAGNIEGHDMKSGDQTLSVASSRQTGLTTRLGTGLNYTFDFNNPTEIGLKAGLEKTFMWQEDEKVHSPYHLPKTPTPESRDTAVYYGLGFNRQFGADHDKLIGIDYMGSKGNKSGSDALTLTYRQQF